MEAPHIKTKKNYDKALERVEIIFDPAPNSTEGDEAEILSLLIENYESKNHPIESPDPIEPIKFRMEEINLQQKNIVGIIGGKSRGSEILNKKKN